MFSFPFICSIFTMQEKQHFCILEKKKTQQTLKNK